MELATAVHVGAGSLALTAGAVALAVRKGDAAHRRAGQAFVLSMLVMGWLGFVLAIPQDDVTSACIGLFVMQLAATGWLAARRATGPGDGRMELALGLAGFGIATVLVVLNLDPARARFAPAFNFGFAGLIAWASALDVRTALRGAMPHPQRLARHFWRVMLALLLAAASFFIGQQDAFPLAIRGWTVWYLPPLVVIVLLAVWLARTLGPSAVQGLWPVRAPRARSGEAGQ